MHPIPPCLALSALYAISLALIGFAGRSLRSKHASDIRVIFYFYSLAATLTVLVTAAAGKYGAIDEGGNFHGSMGELLSGLLHEALVIDNGLLIAAALSLAITMPQVLNYLLSGIFGVGTTALFTQQSLALIVFGIIKPTAVAAGTLGTLAIYGYARAWSGWSISGALSMFAFSLLMLTLSFVTAMQYRDAAGLSHWLSGMVNPPSRNPLASVHQFLTRKNSRAGNGMWDA